MIGGSDVERFMEKAPQVKFSQGYGLTETSPVAMMQYIGSMVKYINFIPGTFEMSMNVF